MKPSFTEEAGIPKQVNKIVGQNQYVNNSMYVYTNNEQLEDRKLFQYNNEKNKKQLEINLTKKSCM